MNIIELKKELTSTFTKDMEMLDTLPVDCEVTHVTNGTVFFKDDSYVANMLTLHNIRKVTKLEWKLRSYYICLERLAMCYSAAGCDYDINLYSTDAENALARVSQGRCKIERKEVTELAAEVVCEVN